MIFDVYKTNATHPRQTWWAGEVEAASADEALRLARDRFPSKNNSDTHAVAERSAERQAEIDREEAERLMRAAGRPLTYAQKCAQRVQAYKNDCIDRKIAALPTINGVPTPYVERIAQEMEKKKS